MNVVYNTGAVLEFILTMANDTLWLLSFYKKAEVVHICGTFIKLMSWLHYISLDLTGILAYAHVTLTHNEKRLQWAPDLRAMNVCPVVFMSNVITINTYYLL